MGNTHSSFGAFLGSIIGGLILIPFNGGTNLIAVTALTGGGIGLTNFIISGKKSNYGTDNDLFFGFGYGMTGSITTTKMISEVVSKIIYSPKIETKQENNKTQIFQDRKRSKKYTAYVNKKVDTGFIQEKELFDRIKIEEAKLLNFNPSILVIKLSRKLTKIYNIPNIYMDKKYKPIYMTHRLQTTLSDMYLRSCNYFYKNYGKKSSQEKIFRMFVYHTNNLNIIVDVYKNDFNTVAPLIREINEHYSENLLSLSNSIINFVNSEKCLMYDERKVKKLIDEMSRFNNSNDIMYNYLCDTINGIVFNNC